MRKNQSVCGVLLLLKGCDHCIHFQKYRRIRREVGGEAHVTEACRLPEAFGALLAHGIAFCGAVVDVCRAAAEYESVCCGDVHEGVIAGAGTFKIRIAGIQAHSAARRSLKYFQYG